MKAPIASAGSSASRPVSGITTTAVNSNVSTVARTRRRCSAGGTGSPWPRCCCSSMKPLTIARKISPKPTWPSASTVHHGSIGSTAISRIRKAIRDSDWNHRMARRSARMRAEEVVASSE